MAKDSSNNHIRMDEILKLLFQVSDKVLLNMMNSLFKENFKLKDTEISISNNEFISEDFNFIRGDFFITLADSKKPHHYHIEFQTLNDLGMAIRMFEYGFSKAKELSKHGKSQESTVYMPKQKVIFVEENNSIKDILSLRIIFPDHQEVHYKVAVMKYWHYDFHRLLEEKLYPLLPLQAFKLRYKIEQIKRKYGEDQERLLELIFEAKNITKKIAMEAKGLYERKEIEAEDLHKILIVAESIFDYLNRKYTAVEEISKEVSAMLKTFYDPVVEQKGIEKGIEQGIEKGIEQGVEKGIEKEAKESIIDFLSELEDYMSFKSEVETMLQEEKDIVKLRGLRKISARAKSVEEFMMHLKKH